LKLPRFFLLSSIGTMLCLSLGCNDTPDPVGISTQPAADYGEVKVDTFYASVVQPTQPNLIFTENIDRVMLGKYQANQGQTYEAWTCLKFDSWPASLLGVRIISATLQLKPFYRFGDTTSSLSINAYRAKASLQGDSLTFDSLDLHGSDYYTNVPINAPCTIQPSDTLCSIILDTAVVREWFVSNIDTTDKNDGIILRPTNANVIKGFYSFNVSDTARQPTLYIRYIDTNGTTEKYYTHKIGLSKYIAQVQNLNINNPDGKMRIQNGISYRGLLAIDPSLDKLSLLWPITIHQAVLHLTLDSASSSCSDKPTPFSQDILYGLSVGANNKPDGLHYASSKKLANNAIYQFNVLAFTIGWIKNTSIRKISFSGPFESGSFDLFTFYGSGSTTTTPKIIITYSIQR
jgi:hypothetical protein